MTALRLRLFLLFVLVFTSTAAMADSQTFGEYTVHYIAVNSTFITPEIAAQYGIVRGKRNAFLNVSVLHNNADGSTTPVTATLQGSKNNLLQQSSALEFREIHEGTAIYYIGEFDFSNAEVLRFKLSVQPEAQSPEYEIEWSTQLYAN